MVSVITARQDAEGSSDADVPFARDALRVTSAFSVVLACMYAWRWWVVRHTPGVSGSSATDALRSNDDWYQRVRTADHVVNYASALWVAVSVTCAVAWVVHRLHSETMSTARPSSRSWAVVGVLVAVALCAFALAHWVDHAGFASAHVARDTDRFARADGYAVVGLLAVATAAALESLGERWRQVS